ncbi:MAG: hypothetical protein ACTJG8_04525 [Canibacter sp.]
MNIDQEVAIALAGLHLGEHFTFEELTGAVQRLRQRRIVVAEVPEIGESSGLCAVLLFSDDRDVILHAHSDSALHTQQFVLHEFAHIILGHCENDSDALAGNIPDSLLPDIPAELRVRALARGDVSTEEEIAAESLADQLAARIRGVAFAETSYTEIFG